MEQEHNSSYLLKQIEGERDLLLQTFKNSFIVKSDYTFEDKEKYYFIMGGGRLFYYLKKEDKFSEEKAKFYAAEIVMALHYLHN